MPEHLSFPTCDPDGSRPRKLVGVARRFLAAIFLLGAFAPTFPAAMGAPFTTVVIDAGHGGHDAGGIPTNIIPEKGVALDVARRVQSYLQSANLRTVMTRSTDTFIPLARRVAIANAQARAIFVSIHFNSAPRRGADGIETFYSSATGKPLARIIQRRVMTTTAGENRGFKKASFYVIRKTRIPAVLVECGFLTNPGDAARASRRDYRDLLARQIANAILEYRKSL